MVAFPLGKLLSLAMKQVSRPIAYQLKSAAKRSPFMRRYICSPPAQGTLINYYTTFRFVQSEVKPYYVAVFAKSWDQLLCISWIYLDEGTRFGELSPKPRVCVSFTVMDNWLVIRLSGEATPTSVQLEGLVASLYQILYRCKTFLQLQSDLKTGNYRIPKINIMLLPHPD